MSTELQLRDDETITSPVLAVASQVALAVLEERARGYEANANFGAWCERRGLPALPAESHTVRLYLVDHAGSLAISTLRRRLSAISEAHQAAQLPNPTISPVVSFAWEGMRRTHGSSPRAKEAAITAVVAAMVQPLGSALIEVRDRAVLLIGFAGAMRRSELPALDAAGVTETGEGLRITLRRSKTDQEGGGATVGITYGSNPPTCPVRGWRAWVEAAEITDGPAFRNLRNGRVTTERLSGGALPAWSSDGPRRPACPRSCPAALATQWLRHHGGPGRRGRAPNHAPGPMDHQPGHAGLYPGG